MSSCPRVLVSFVRRYADQFFHINGDGSEDSGDEHALYTLPHLPDAAAAGGITAAAGVGVGVGVGVSAAAAAAAAVAAAAAGVAAAAWEPHGELLYSRAATMPAEA